MAAVVTFDAFDLYRVEGVSLHQQRLATASSFLGRGWLAFAMPPPLGDATGTLPARM